MATNRLPPDSEDGIIAEAVNTAMTNPDRLFSGMLSRPVVEFAHALSVTLIDQQSSRSAIVGLAGSVHRRADRVVRRSHRSTGGLPGSAVDQMRRTRHDADRGHLFFTTHVCDPLTGAVRGRGRGLFQGIELVTDRATKAPADKLGQGLTETDRALALLSSDSDFSSLSVTVIISV